MIDVFSEHRTSIHPERIIPRLVELFPEEAKEGSGRLSHPHVRKASMANFDVLNQTWNQRHRPLAENFKGILELSCRAPYCPDCFVLDTMMGVCSFNCIYCFTALSVSSLMTSFFDDPAPLRPRYANPDFVTKELDEVLNARGVEPQERLKDRGMCRAVSETNALKKAAAQRVPLRFGTRSENFLPQEKEKHAALAALKVIRDHQYPLIINTKSTLVLEPPYWDVITEMENVAVQVSITHTDDEVAHRLEPGAPSATERWGILAAFNSVGINAMPRMEPCANFLNTDDAHLTAYFRAAQEAKCRKFMGDAYHHTVKAAEVQRLFNARGFDFDRIWWSTAEFQILGSYAMEKAMWYAKQAGLKAGSFNYHSIPWNDEDVCCMVGELFEHGAHPNRFSAVFALREIIKHGQMSFTDFDQKFYGCELHPGIRARLQKVWNLELDNCFAFDFCEGMEPLGRDGEGSVIWRFNPSFMGDGYRNLERMFGEANG